MSSEQFIENNWYSVIYPSGFRIIFQVVDMENNSASFCRKDGVYIESLPENYQEIILHGVSEPDYQ